MTRGIRLRACALIIENESVLLVEFQDENGLHYNLPGGGVEPGETVKEAARREVMEEASIEVDVGSLALVYEYAPHLCEQKYGDRASLQLIFECKRKDGSIPKIPVIHDANQTGVKWIKLRELKDVFLYPDLKEEIIQYDERKMVLGLVEEHVICSSNH